MERLRANAEEQKPLATQAGESIAPYAKAVGDTVSRTMAEFMAGGNGPLAEGARANLKMQDQRERAANRGTRKTMKECIKCGFHDTWTLSPRSFGHSFHAHLDT